MEQIKVVDVVEFDIVNVVEMVVQVEQLHDYDLYFELLKEPKENL